MASSDDPPFLNVGTEVSAKYRGAFCEATVKIAKKLVKCKVSYTKGHTETVPNDVIKGPLKVGANVEVRQSDGQYLNGVILKLTDATTYTVVFDDGDERTLKRSSLCLKGGRHYSASESLDQMPLTDPENFGTPVNSQTKRGNRKRIHTSQSCSPEGESLSPAKKSSNGISSCTDFPVGKCVFLENDRRRSSWLPAVVVPSHYIMDESEVSEDTVCIRSFKDGRFYAAKAENLHTFAPTKEPLLSMLEGDIHSMYMCKPAIERAMAYLDTGDLPWDMDLLDSQDVNHRLSSTANEEMTDDQKADSKCFYERLMKFQEEKGIVACQPSLAHQDLDLYKLYRLVRDNGGMEKVTQEFKWRSLYLQMGMPPMTNASYMIKQAYKRYLNAFECYEKAKEEGKLRNPRKRVTVPDSDEEVENLSIKQEKVDDCNNSSTYSHVSNWLLEQDNEQNLPSDGLASEAYEEGMECHNNLEAMKEDINVNDRVKVLYGRGKGQQTYEAKVLEVDNSNSDHVIYYIHYNGWNTRYDEWVEGEKILGKVTTPTKGPRRPAYAKKKHGKMKTMGKPKENGLNSLFLLTLKPEPLDEFNSSIPAKPPMQTPSSLAVLHHPKSKHTTTSSTTSTTTSSAKPVRRRRTSSSKEIICLPEIKKDYSDAESPPRIPPIFLPDGTTVITVPQAQKEMATNSTENLEDSQLYDIKKEQNEKWFEYQHNITEQLGPSIHLTKGITSVQELAMDKETTNISLPCTDVSNTPLTVVTSTNTNITLSVTNSSQTIKLMPDTGQPISPQRADSMEEVNSPKNSLIGSPRDEEENRFTIDKDIFFSNDDTTSQKGHDSGVENSSGSDDHANNKPTASSREELNFAIDSSSFADLCTSERIALIQDRMKAIQSKYMELKSEILYLERRKRRARRKEREVARLMESSSQDHSEPSNSTTAETHLLKQSSESH